jgi:hypothetical protein
LTCSFERSSHNYDNAQLSEAERLIDICKVERCSTYVNPIGGQQLYDKAHFSTEGIELRFLEAESIQYQQFGNTYVPCLSIVDVLMFNSPEKIRKNFLTAYKFQ